MSRPSPAMIECLKRDFDVACAHFKHSSEAREVAWQAAITHLDSSIPVYRAIANSLDPILPGERPPKPLEGRRALKLRQSAGAGRRLRARR